MLMMVVVKCLVMLDNCWKTPSLRPDHDTAAVLLSLRMDYDLPHLPVTHINLDQDEFNILNTDLARKNKNFSTWLLDSTIFCL